MESNNKTGIFWKVSVVLLVLINICLLATTWIKPKSKEHQPPMDNGSPAVYVIRQLNFTEKQIKAYNALRDRHHDSVIILTQQGEELRNNYFDNLKTNTPDVHLRDSLANAIADNQKQIELVTFSHFVQVRQLCNDTQKQKFDQIINGVLKMMARPMRGQGGAQRGDRPPGGPDGPPPGGPDNGPPPQQ